MSSSSTDAWSEELSSGKSASEAEDWPTSILSSVSTPPAATASDETELPCESSTVFSGVFFSATGAATLCLRLRVAGNYRHRRQLAGRSGSPSISIWVPRSCSTSRTTFQNALCWHILNRSIYVPNLNKIRQSAVELLMTQQIFPGPVFGGRICSPYFSQTEQDQIGDDHRTIIGALYV